MTNKKYRIRRKQKYKIIKQAKRAQKGGLFGFEYLMRKLAGRALKMVEHKRNYPMRKLNKPKRVTLRNGRTFVTRYKRISRKNLLPNICIKRNRRRAVRGRGIASTIKKLINNPVVKAIAKKGLEYAPGVYKNLTKRIKSKTAQKILNSDLAHLALSQAIKSGNKLLS